MNNDGPQPPTKERRRSTVQEVLSKRRDEQYAHVEGPLHSGRLSMWTYLSYAAPSLSTTPCSVLISVYLVPFYETVGAKLAYIAFFPTATFEAPVVFPDKESAPTDVLSDAVVLASSAA